MQTLLSLHESATQQLEVCGWKESASRTLVAYHKGEVYGMAVLPYNHLLAMTARRPPIQDWLTYDPYSGDLPEEVGKVAREWRQVVDREIKLLKSNGKMLAGQGAKAMIEQKRYEVLADLCDDLGLHFLADQMLRRPGYLETPYFAFFGTPAQLGAKLIDWSIVQSGPSVTDEVTR